MKKVSLIAQWAHFGLAAASLCVGFSLRAADAAPKITPPRAVAGFDIGDDYCMLNYTQISTLWKKWATESDRMKVVSIGNSAEGRPQLMAIVSAPENIRQLDHYKEISRRLSLAEGLTDAQAHDLAEEGKAVVWIDGGLHSSESINSQQLTLTVYELISRSDKETMRFLRDVILIAPIANPDGVEVVANWLMRNEDPKKRTFVGLPRLYNKYVGHDNNRDFFMANMPETENQNRVLYREWFPQIMYNHHQTGPEGEVIFIPPFRDPFNYNLDALIPIGIERVGIAMHERLIAMGMGGSGMRSAANYSTWWNGGARTDPYFHNQIGILTEVVGSPVPITIPLVPNKQLPSGDWPLPIAPQAVWHYRQGIEYDNQANRAVLDYASRQKETLLYNIYRMGKNSIERGSKDTWTITPKRIEALIAAAKQRDPSFTMAYALDGVVNPATDVSVVPSDLYAKVLHDPAKRDARGYILPSDQDDFATAVKFVNALLKNGVAVDKATATFTVAGKTYPAGSYVVQSAQAYRPFVMDMFEPQDHPNDLAYPGGPPHAPYDIAGWTLAVQMGVKFDRILDGFSGPFERIGKGYDLEKPPVEAVTGGPDVKGWLVSHKINDSFVLTNRLLKAGCDVFWFKEEQTVNGLGLGTGSVWVPATAASRPIVERAARELGVPAYGLTTVPTGSAVKLKPIRVGLVDLYGGLMPSGWLRWMLEQYEFPFEVVYPQILDAGGLKNSFDVIVFPSQTYATGARTNNRNMERAVTRNAGTGMAGNGGAHYDPPAESIPEEYRSMLGNITSNKTIPPLKKFIDEGGTIVAIGSSATIGEAMGMSVSDHLVEKGPDGTEHHLPVTKFYVPGSVLEANFDITNPIAYGMAPHGYVFFDSSPAFDIGTGPGPKINRAVWFAGKHPLYSGWALGQEYLDGGDLAAETSLGQGKLVLIALEATFRGTPHANFKLLFNSLYYGSATETSFR
jgi:hypothetical protein